MTYVYNSQLDAFTLYHIQEEESPSRSSIGPALPALGHALSGAAGTAISKLLIYPLDLVITRLQVQAQFQDPSTPTPTSADYTSLLDAATKIYNNEGGIAAFYSGVVPDTAKSVADSFLFFLAYNYLRSRRLTSRGSARTLPALDEIAVGMLAGAFSKLWTTPVQNIVTRKQTAAMVASQDPMATASPDLSLRDIALQIRHEKGLQGFWSGYSASLVLTLNPAVTFLLHKILLRALVPRARREDPGARVTFLVAALSKSVASAVTYPFSLAKTRAQVSRQAPSEAVGQTSESEKKVVKEGEALIAAKAKRARQRTVFSTILRVAKTEGVAALYHGLGAEMLKGFFSHGLTMLMKDRIHGVIVSLYYLLLKAAKKYPGPDEIRAMASRRANGAYESGKELAGNASQYAGDVVANGRSQAGELFEKGRELAGSAAEQAKGVVEKGTDGAKGMIGSGKEEK
ncbi:mitochondrial carrier [Mytilinidion resinicola]|uniref:Mitochondrial carrier n=1 Tax=Mytilinidion resinicola TaxID=574789 RepID=A0A6A6Y3J2_9PEZI|nr:mitochondrial carrier [Mytilinidion resinicola]KAF2803352.1 mitochondrial carrier [Mytilinidion resinicola]